MVAPSLRPIQLRCIVFVESDQSSVSSASSSSCAYRVIFSHHCRRNRVSTTVWQRSHLPPSTCSSASTVLHDGHQFTAPSRHSASPCLKSWRNTHCVQR